TRNALRELEERNTKVSRDSARTRNIRRRTRRRTSVQEASRLQRVDRFVDRCSPACLKRIKRFARHGGLDLRDIRGYRTPAEAQDGMSSSQSSLGRRKRGSQSPKKRGSQSPSKSNATPNTTSTRSTGPYDRTFQQHLIDHNILPLRYEYPDGRLPPEPDNMDEIHRALAQPRASLSPSKFTNDDFRKFERADAQSFKERQVMTKVIPMFEGNGPDRSLSVASRQACYDGALGARGIHSLQSYGQLQPQYDNKAYTFASIYHGGTFKMFTSHPIPPSAPGEQPAGDTIVTSQETVLNPSSNAPPSLCESDTSEDELSRDFRPPAKRTSRSPLKKP
ncbi:hypothetical protein TOPH_08337, partial [Tolypocladium ophioglossoides CBS 100239]